MNCMLQIHSQLSIIKIAIRNIESDIKAFRKDSRLLITEIRLIKCIEEIQHVFKATKMLECFFNNALMLQFVVIIIVICTLIYALQLVILTLHQS